MASRVIPATRRAIDDVVSRACHGPPSDLPGNVTKIPPDCVLLRSDHGAWADLHRMLVRIGHAVRGTLNAFRITPFREQAMVAMFAWKAASTTSPRAYAQALAWAEDYYERTHPTPPEPEPEAA